VVALDYFSNTLRPAGNVQIEWPMRSWMGTVRTCFTASMTGETAS
jgi:hypothetical protein